MKAPQRKGLFVAGTDTGVGKTTFSRALLRVAWQRKISVLPMKPVETGVGPNGPADAHALIRASGAAVPVGQVCPHAYPLPVAPVSAAAACGESLDVEALAQACERALPLRASLLVESAGGLLTPLTPQQTNLDLALRLALPLMLITRNGLGTINHTALSLHELSRRGAPPMGTFLVNTGPLGPDAPTNAANIMALCGVPVWGPLPFLPNATDDELAYALIRTLPPPVLENLLDRLR